MKNTIDRIKTNTLKLFQYKYFPVFLFLICILAYGLLTPWLSVFADDLSFLFYFRTLGRSGLFQAFASERPVQGLLYTITFPILGTSPLIWQIFGLLTRWLVGIALWLMLNALWPHAKKQNIWIVILFTVFPGFQEHWVVVTYSHAYLMLAFAFFSLWSMLKSFTAGKKWGLFLALSLLFSAINISMTEYFFGIELSRPVIIWIYLLNSNLNLKSKFKDLLKKYWPYLILLVLYFIWRFIIFHSDKYNIRLSTIYGDNFLIIIVGLLKNIVFGFFKVAIQVWAILVQFLPFSSFSGFNLVIWVMLIINLLIISVYLILSHKANPSKKENEKRKILFWCLQAFSLATISIIFALVPYLLGGYTIKLEIPWDRFLLAFMFPSSLFVIAIFELIGLRSRQITYILAILFIALSMSKQFATANSYRKALILEREFYWQLSWRIPSLQPDTMLLTDSMNLPYYSENILSAQLNYLYDPNLDSSKMQYVLAFIDGRIRDEIIEYNPGLPINLCDRIICFEGNTSDIVVFKYYPQSCLIIMDPIYSNAETLAPDLSPSLRSAINLSSLARIQVSGVENSIPSSFDFGPEPAHDWCYYFEKADLARQRGDWQTVIDLWNQSQALDFKPSLAPEYYPFIEAFAYKGDWNSAMQLTLSASTDSTRIIGICNLWNRIDSQVNNKSLEGTEVVQSLLTEMDCDSR